MHRVTAGRWIAEARERILVATKEELKSATNMQPSEVESVLAFVCRQSSLGEQIARAAEVLRTGRSKQA